MSGYLKIFCPNCLNVLTGELIGHECALCGTKMTRWSKLIESNAIEEHNQHRGQEVGVHNPGTLVYRNRDGSGGKVQAHFIDEPDWRG